jgi:hypothetical protein
MKKQLQQMEVELRELMVYQSPPELGALYTEVEEMMKQMGKEQSILIAKEMQIEYARLTKRRKRIEKLWIEATWGVGAIVIAGAIGLMIAFVIEDRIKKYPHLGNDWIPKSEAQRRLESIPQRYTGR